MQECPTMPINWAVFVNSYLYFVDFLTVVVPLLYSLHFTWLPRLAILVQRKKKKMKKTVPRFNGTTIIAALWLLAIAINSAAGSTLWWWSSLMMMAIVEKSRTKGTAVLPSLAHSSPWSHPQVSKAFYPCQCPLTCPLLISNLAIFPLLLFLLFTCRVCGHFHLSIYCCSCRCCWSCFTWAQHQQRCWMGVKFEGEFSEQGASAHLSNRFHLSVFLCLYLLSSDRLMASFIRSLSSSNPM